MYLITAGSAAPAGQARAQQVYRNLDVQVAAVAHTAPATGE
ncbi:hypothetical protein [Streptomyces sp. KM273126]|nr:hypothetical protein [Streptomyces sp. KM273126]